MKRNTILKVYVLIMISLCTIAIVMMVHLSVSRGNDWACNILAFIFASVIALVIFAWPPDLDKYDIDKALEDAHIRYAFKKKFRNSLKKHLESLN